MLRPSLAIALAFGLLPLAGRVVAQQASFQPGPIFPADATLDSVFSGGFFLEGPAAAADGTVYFSDITITAQSGGHRRKPPSTGIIVPRCEFDAAWHRKFA